MRFVAPEKGAVAQLFLGGLVKMISIGLTNALGNIPELTPNGAKFASRHTVTWNNLPKVKDIDVRLLAFCG